MSYQRAVRRRPEVRAVRSSRHPGAYGDWRDVAAALEALRYAAPESSSNAGSWPGTTEEGLDESDAFLDAWDDVMLGHVWHQGCVYPVTPIALGFFLDVLRERRADAELAEFPAVVAEAAVRACAAADEDERRVGRAILDVLEARAGELDVAARVLVPALWAAHARDAGLADVLRAGRTACPDALRWATARLDESGDPVKVAAAGAAAIARGTSTVRSPRAWPRSPIPARSPSRVSLGAGFVFHVRPPRGPAVSVRFPPYYECGGRIGGEGTSGLPGRDQAEADPTNPLHPSGPAVRGDETMTESDGAPGPAVVNREL